MQKLIFKGIWQYKFSLSYLREHLKLYINFLYNYSVCCLVFEINRFILIKIRVHSAILGMHSLCMRKNYSTASALLANTDSWLLNMDAGMINGVLFLDLCKAFVTLDHGILLSIYFIIIYLWNPK